MADKFDEEALKRIQDGFSLLGISEYPYPTCAVSEEGFYFEQCSLLTPTATIARSNSFPDGEIGCQTGPKF